MDRKNPKLQHTKLKKGVASSDNKKEAANPIHRNKETTKNPVDNSSGLLGKIELESRYTGNPEIQTELAACTIEVNPLLECLVYLTKYHGTPRSAESLVAGLPDQHHSFTPRIFLRAAQRAGFHAKVIKKTFRKLSKDMFPVVIPFKDGDAGVLLDTFFENKCVEIMLPDNGGIVERIAISDLEERWSGYVILVQPENPIEFDRPDEKRRDPSSWFWGTLRQNWWIYSQVVMAAVFVNLFGLISPMFVMIVYDRVIPNNAQETLWVLASGVLTVIVFDLILKTLRAFFIDYAGKRADILMGSRLFDQVLDMRLAGRPKSAGVFANTLREFETLREFFTSATLAAVIDLPFVLLFLFVLWMISGPVSIVLMIAVPLVLGYGFLLQIPLRNVVKKNLNESNIKHGVLVETINGLETIKAVGAEGRMRGLWEQALGATASSGQKSRALSTSGVNFTSWVQQTVSVGVMLYGVQLIGKNELTMGALIACVMLGGRAIAPLAQLAQLVTRLNQSMASLKNLNEIMSAPVERSHKQQFIHRPQLGGEIEFRNVSFRYPGTDLDILKGVSFKINLGESVGFIGRVGSGKSTLAKLILGLYEPTEGTVLVDGIDLRQIDPADLRRNIGYVPQDPFLFQGTAKDNITAAAPFMEDAAIIRAAKLAGVSDFLEQHPLGYNLPVGERGDGLSGGQRQGLTIARALLRLPNILVMDEPTSSMDAKSEQELRNRLRDFLKDRTLLLITHRASLLSFVDRIIVLDNGQLLADGPRKQILDSLATGKLANSPREREKK
ncbi:MAG: type I secretion system permease/ATPase [Magnetococcales bacterium]|nr:type I secretion system permease/ATPase [Magnetococcales bacterium]